MQPELAADCAYLRGPDQPGVGNRHRVERSLEGLQPERQELVQDRKPRAEIVILPDKGLQQRGMIRKPVKNLCRSEAVAFELASKIFGCHSDALRFSDISVIVTSHTVQAETV